MGIAGADKPEGIRRAFTTPLESPPGEVFNYADINFILLGALIEKLSGEPEDVYVQQNVFAAAGHERNQLSSPGQGMWSTCAAGSCDCLGPCANRGHAGPLSFGYVEHESVVARRTDDT